MDQLKKKVQYSVFKSVFILLQITENKHPETVLGKLTPLTSNENCDVYTVKNKRSGEQLVVKAVPCDEYDIEGVLLQLERCLRSTVQAENC